MASPYTGEGLEGLEAHRASLLRRLRTTGGPEDGAPHALPSSHRLDHVVGKARSTIKSHQFSTANPTADVNSSFERSRQDLSKSLWVHGHMGWGWGAVFLSSALPR
jgi:hypothetical protein